MSWGRWWTAAWCSRRQVTASGVSGCWTRSATTRWGACGTTTLTGARRTIFTRPITRPWPSQAEAELQGLGQLTWLRRLETEHANLAAAMLWLAGQDLPDVTVGLAWKTWRFWWLQGHADEFSRFSVAVLSNSAHLAPHRRALALGFGAFESLARGDNDRAQGLFEQSMPLFRQTGDKLRVALIASVLGHLLALQHQEADASAMLDQSQTLIKELDTHELTGADRIQKLATVALTYNFLGQIRLSQADARAAAGLHTQAVSAAHQALDRFQSPRLAVRPGPRQPRTRRPERHGSAPCRRAVAGGRGR